MCQVFHEGSILLFGRNNNKNLASSNEVPLGFTPCSITALSVMLYILSKIFIFAVSRTLNPSFELSWCAKSAVYAISFIFCLSATARVSSPTFTPVRAILRSEALFHPFACVVMSFNTVAVSIPLGKPSTGAICSHTPLKTSIPGYGRWVPACSLQAHRDPVSCAQLPHCQPPETRPSASRRPTVFRCLRSVSNPCRHLRMIWHEAVGPFFAYRRDVSVSALSPGQSDVGPSLSAFGLAFPEKYL